MVEHFIIIIIIIFRLISLDILISQLISFNEEKDLKEFIVEYLKELEKIIIEDSQGGGDNKGKDFFKKITLIRQKYLEKAEIRDKLDTEITDYYMGVAEDQKLL